MLQGKNIVVTGAASGIGKRTAELAHTMGANVFSIDRDTPRNSVGHFIQGDLGTEGGVGAILDQLPAGLDAFKSKNIRVNAVSPGPVETPILEQFRNVLGDARVNSDIDRVGRAGTADDIAPTIAFLASDMARWVNGTNIACDGGLEASVMAEVMGF